MPTVDVLVDVVDAQRLVGAEPAESSVELTVADTLHAEGDLELAVGADLDDLALGEDLQDLLAKVGITHCSS